MDSKITINIVEPGSSTPVDPVAPNTGLFTHGIGGPEATIIAVSTILALALVAAIVWCYKKHTNIHLSNITKHIKSKKSIAIGLTALAILVSAGTFAALLVNAGKSNTNATEGEDEAIAPVVSSDELTIELGNEPVFAVAKTEVTVEKATDAGYTLTAFAESTDLVSTTDSSKVIPMIAVDEGELAALANNTYGLTLAEPASQAEEVYTALSTDADNPTLLAEKEEETKADDKTTIYYGFYITPDTPYGTYTSGDVYYDVEENRTDLATVIFDGNGLTFDGAETNSVKYITNVSMGDEAYSHTPNVDDEGVQDGMYPIGLNNTFVYRFADTATEVNLHLVRMEADGTCGPNNDQYFSFWQGNHPDYTAVANWESGEKVSGSDGKYIFANGSQYAGMDATVEGNTLTFAYTTSDHRGGYCGNSGYGYYAIITATDADGNSVELLGNEQYKGSYLTPGSEESTKFLGWSTDPDAATPMYGNEKDVALGLTLAAGDEVTLYAVYEPTFAIVYNGNGDDATTNMDNVNQYTTVLEPTDKQVDLLASNFKKEGYGFAGWSTDQDAASKINNTGDDKPTIYGPNQMITIDENLIAEAGENRKLVLNAVWVPAETGVTMQTFNPNSEPYASKPNGTVIALKDERDNQVYAVAKLADGNYWMIENLRLDNEPELSANNTHNPNLPLTNDYEEEVTSNKLSASSDSWCNSWSTTEEQIACYDHSNLNTNNVANAAVSPNHEQDFTNAAHQDFSASIVSYGNYYNWYSATAGQGTYSVSSGNAAGDICPTGWQLPYGGSSTSTGGGNTKGGFYYLNQQMGGGTSATDSNNWRSFPNNFVYSGYWYGSSAGSRGNGGYYWSSTANVNGSAYNLYLDSGYVRPDDSYNKSRGFSVRCVAPVQ